MLKTLKNKVFIGAFIATLAVFGVLSYKAEALTTSANTTVLPVGCDLGVGTVYSPETGESCSVGGVTITPPIVMMPPYDAYGCKAGSPYSMTTGNKCAGVTPTPLPPIYYDDGCTLGAMYNISTGKKCVSITPVPPIYDCSTAKNAYCAGITNPVNGVCADGTVKMYNTGTGVAYCTTTTPPTWIPPVKISSTSDVAGIQNALNKSLGIRLSAYLATDGKMGPKTVAAVRMFQAQVGIAVDGKVGPVTLGKLNASVE